MRTALIGHTGFVGQNLARQARFDERFNSQNIEEIAGKTYDLLVCAGARAEKWLANQEPQRDREGIARLTDALGKVRANRVILISTVDVFKSTPGVDEQTPVDRDGLCPYGDNRYELEEFVRSRFSTLVVRLPGLFGQGLKKNILYDFLHGNQTDRIHHASVYQFYDLERLWSDIHVANEAKLELVHFATEPVSVGEVACEVFQRRFDNAPAVQPARYDFRSRHAGLFGGRDGYLSSKPQVLEAMRQFAGRQERVAA
jgi:nucleoside-diphosphate-sugar epimerase